MVWFSFFRKHEKELRKVEKEQRRTQKEEAKKLEKEAARQEKLNRHNEKISRSTERVAPRSGSLERRQSGEENAVLSQFTVHGIASPNKRPTLFDVFRPRTKSDTKKSNLVKPTEKEGSAHNSHGGSGGIMSSMRTAIQHTVGGHHKPSGTTKVKDGSAHLHAGSDAQVKIS